MSDLPNGIKMDIIFHRDHDVFQRFRVLRDCNVEMQKKLGLVLKPLSLFTDCLVFEEGYTDMNIYFVFQGTVEIIKGSSIATRGSFMYIEKKKDMYGSNTGETKEEVRDETMRGRGAPAWI